MTGILDALLDFFGLVLIHLGFFIAFVFGTVASGRPEVVPE